MGTSASGAAARGLRRAARRGAGWRRPVVAVLAAVASLVTGSLVPASAAGAAGSVPGVPTGVTAQPGNTSATVSFTVPADGGSPITGYFVAAFDGGTLAAIVAVTSNLVAVAGATQTVVFDPVGAQQLQNGTAYTFAVVADNANGTSATSARSAAITVGAPVAPANVVVQPGNGSATVSFAVPAANASPITGYIVIAETGGVGASVIAVTTGLVTTAGATQTVTFDPTGSLALQDGTSYGFVVVAFNAEGVSPASTTSLPVVPGGVAPAAPADVMAAPGNGTASVSFYQPPYAGPALSAYEVEVFDGPVLVGTQLVTGGLGLAGTAPANETTVIGPASGGPQLRNGVGYTFDVVGFDRDGASPVSAAAQTLLAGTSAATSTIVPSAALAGSVPAASAYLASRIEAAQVPPSLGVANGGGAIGESGPRSFVRPYLAGYAAAGLAAFGQSAGGAVGATAEADVLAYLQWYSYAETVSPSHVVDDWSYDASTGTWASTGSVGSVDAPAGLFLLAADRYLAAMTAMGDGPAALAQLQAPPMATGILDAIGVIGGHRDAVGLTEENPAAGYPFGALEDNAEVYGGLTGAVQLFDAIGTPSALGFASYVQGIATGIRHAVQADLWDPSVGAFFWVYTSTTSTGPCTASICNVPVPTYETAGNVTIEENLWAVAWGLATPAQASTVMGLPGVANYTGSFADPLMNATPPTDIVDGQSGYPNAPNYVGAGLWALQATGRQAAATTDLIAITAFGEHMDAGWPFDSGSIGALLLSADAGGVPVPS